MKPLNNDNPGCNPISSNCVIWQGPDIPCIKLCKGDTVSDTVYKLATELCYVLDQIDVTTYDLSCLNLTECTPKDFHALIQLLIDKICALNECCNNTPGDPTGRVGCPDDCIVEVCPAFQYTDPFGNLVVTMTLKEYVIAIGNKVCSIVQQITTINATLQDHETRITYIEDNCCDQTPPPLPNLTPTCIGTPPLPLELSDFVQTLEAAFCELRNATGTATELYLAISRECPGLDGESQLSAPGTMSSIPGWVPIGSYGTVADAINNMWLTICDMRAAIQYIQNNCCPGGCEDFVINIAASYVNPVLTLYFTGAVPAGYVACSGLGTQITITDGFGNSITPTYNIIGNINNPSGIPINLSSTILNLASNYTITSDVCIYNASTDSQCSKMITYNVTNQSSCPLVELTSTPTSIGYSLGVLVVGTYVVELLSSCGSTSPISVNTHVVGSLTTVTGSFTSLPSNTAYVIRVKLQIYSGPTLISETVCPCTSITTDPGLCDPPVISSETPPYIQIL